MLSKIIKNSAAAVKIKAKLHSSLNDTDYDNMIKCGSVPKIAEYLRRNDSYREIFSGVDIANLHRGEMEEMIKLITRNEIKSFVSYLDMNTRSFLKIYMIRDEIEGIKLCARKLYSNTDIRFDDRYIRKYLMLSSSVNFPLLFEAESFDEFITAVKKSDYEEIFLSLKSDVNRQTLFNIETILDFYYIRTVVKYINKYYKGEENKNLRMLLGTETDLLNISAVIRAKKYYKMNREEIYSILFMESNKLSREDITRIVEAETAELAAEEVKNTAYKNLVLDDNFLDRNVDRFLFNVHLKQLRMNPYSSFSIVSYLFIKRFELKNIITVIEGVRYGIDPENIKKYIISAKSQ